MIDREGDAKADAELDFEANVHGVDVVFAKDGGMERVSNLFAIVIGDAAVVVRGGHVVQIITRKAHARGGFKERDLYQHLRLFG